MSKVDEAAQTMINNLPEKTGKSLDEWLKITQALGLTKHGEIMKVLKGDHGVSHGFANLITHMTLNSAAFTMNESTDLVSEQYSGPKADLRPIYDKLESIIKSFGSDVEFAPKKAYVSLRRNKQFALIQPTTKTRIDVGINLKGKAPEGRLEASGSFNAMVSHRVKIESIDQVDDELTGWLKEAYDLG